MQIPQVSEQIDRKKYYGLQNGGFKRGMNSDPYTGVGLQLAVNVYRKDGKLKKMPGESLVHNFGDVIIVKIDSYQKSNGAFQTLVWYENTSNEVYMRAIEADGTIVTPTGGSGDVDFGDTNISYKQISLTGYVTSETDSTFYAWDGTELGTVTGTRSNVLDMSMEGRRLNYIYNGVIAASGSDANPITNITSGTGAQANAEYKPNISGFPIGLYNLSSGHTLMAFNSGFELHQLAEKESGNGLYEETRVSSFQYKGEGVDSKNKVAIGNYYIYALTKKGLTRIDPANGKSVNLIEELKKSKAEKIRRYFKLWDQSSSQMGYVPEEEMIVFNMSTNGISSDVLVCYHEPSGDFYIKKLNSRCFGVVNNNSYYADYLTGKLYRMFDENSLTNGNGNKYTTRIVNEWDAVSGMGQVTLPLDFYAFIDLHSESSAEINLYVNGDTTNPVLTITYNGQDTTDTSVGIGMLGDYILGVGSGDESENADVYIKDGFHQPFHSYCWEILETSDKDFVINDVCLEFDVLNEISQTKSFAQELFTI